MGDDGGEGMKLMKGCIAGWCDLMDAVLHSGWITVLNDVILSPREQN